jgi:hypothetical protein
MIDFSHLPTRQYLLSGGQEEFRSALEHHVLTTRYNRKEAEEVLRQFRQFCLDMGGKMK